MKLLRKWTKIMLCTVALGCALMGTTVFAADTTTVNVNVTYGQTEARKMLDMINTFRQGSDAWYWNSADSEKITCSGLSNYVYDYNLEAIAMQRAAEIAVSFSHTRPDGEAWSSFTVGGTSTNGENIAVGYNTASSAFAGWQEEDAKYAGQGHRRNMLNSSYTAIGIGHVYFNGTHYWVQEFGRATSSASQTVANDSATKVAIDVLNSYVNTVSISPSVNSCSVLEGASVALPTLTVKISLTESWPSTAFPVEVDYDWSCANSQIAKVENGVLNGVSAGTTTISATVFAQTGTVNVTVLDPQKVAESSSETTTTTENATTATTERATEATTTTTEKATEATTATTERETEKTTEAATSNTGSRQQVLVGEETTYKSAKYVVTDNGNKELTVTYKKNTKLKAKTVNVPANVTIEGTRYKVTEVSANAFKNNKQLTAISLPSSVETIGKNAFSGCKKLKTIVIKSSKLTSAGVSKGAFKGISKNTVIKVPKKKVKSYTKLFQQKGLSKKVKVQSY